MNHTNHMVHNKPTAGVTISVNEAWCKRCGICSEFCPAQVFETDDFGLPVPVNPQRCTACMLCVVLCPDFALEVRAISSEPDSE